jgi:hypothetical protein
MHCNKNQNHHPIILIYINIKVIYNILTYFIIYFKLFLKIYIYKGNL